MNRPGGLAEYRQFVLWNAEPSSTRPGKTDKFPIHPVHGYRVGVTDTTAWISYDEAAAALAQGRAQGIGFVFTENDPFFFFDIDNAVVNGQWSELATRMFSIFQGCYFEVSQSGKGIHFIGSATGKHACKNTALGIELYTKGRFCALTGAHAAGTALANAQPQFDWLVASYFASGAADTSSEWTDSPVAEWYGPENDDELIARMLASRPSAASVFGGRATVQDLWSANIQRLSEVWPDPRGFDHSSADIALCTHLAFWTGKNCERMNRLFERSGLMREKWSRPDYKQSTVLKGISFCTGVLGSNKQRVDEEPAAPNADGLRPGYQYMSITQQQEHFKGCCYVRDLHCIFTPDGALLKSEQFRVAYGGYTFSLDFSGDKSTRNAWEAFTESQAFHFPKANSTCFRPEHAAGEIVTEEGISMVNIFVPVETKQLQGDPTPFLSHISRMLPNLRDQAILLAYMAAVVQFPGRKFNWAPLIQGTKGNGKSLLCDILAYCVGNRFTARPDPEDISNKFNAWIVGKALVIIDEAYVADRRDMENVLKRLITGKRLAIQGKGKDQFTGDNRANFVLNTNWKNAVRVDDDERRYAIFFTDQQSKADLERSGMGGNYFPRFAAWLEADGYAIINSYLRSYRIPDELNPATLCHRAPITSSTRAAVSLGAGVIEQEVLEAIAQDRPGFAGGWGDSLALDALLEDNRWSAKIPRSQRRELWRSLGYDYHPALKEGRVSFSIPGPAGVGKPHLYYKIGSNLGLLTTETDIIRAYLQAQSSVSAAAQAFGGTQ